jgi:hypothetical protein
MRNAQQTYSEADKRLEKTHSTLDGLIATSLPAPAQETLLFPEETKLKISG